MAQFDAYIPLLQAAEGGYQKLYNDNGNWTGGKIGIGNLVGTNHGISAPVYAKWIGRTPTEADMRAITPKMALEIYKAWYWNAMQASYINNQSIANIIVDHGVNAGIVRAAKLVQKALNEAFGFNLKIDGAIGDNTLTALNSVNQERLHDVLKAYRIAYYESIGGEFLKSWRNRLKSFVFEKKKSSQYLA